MVLAALPGATRAAPEFDSLAADYDTTRSFPPAVLERVVAGLLELAGARPDSRILDVGIGTGRLALPLIAGGFGVVGVDPSVEMLSALRRKAHGEACPVVRADGAALPFGGGQFDIVLTCQVLHLVPQPGRLLEEVKRVLGGRGVYLNGEGPRGPWWDRISRQWEIIAAGRGVSLPRTGRPTASAIRSQLERLGGRLSRHTLAMWPGDRTVGAVAAELAGRVKARSPVDSPAMAERMSDELDRWLARELGPRAERPMDQNFDVVRVDFRQD